MSFVFLRPSLPRGTLRVRGKQNLPVSVVGSHKVFCYMPQLKNIKKLYRCQVYLPQKLLQVQGAKPDQLQGRKFKLLFPMGVSEFCSP